MPQILQQLRAAIRSSDKTAYRIAHDAGVSPTQLSRLMNRKAGLSIDVVERIAKAMDLEIIMRPKPGKKEK